MKLTKRDINLLGEIFDTYCNLLDNEYDKVILKKVMKLYNKLKVEVD